MITSPTVGAAVTLTMDGKTTETSVSEVLLPQPEVGIPTRVAFRGIPGYHELPVAWAALVPTK